MNLIKRSALISLMCSTLFSTTVYADDCDNAANDSEVHQCLQTKKDDAEKTLNAEYVKTKERIQQGLRDSPSDTKTYMELFVKAQRSWLMLRDYQCQMESFGADKKSNVYLDSTNECVAKMDNERTATLKKIPYDGLSNNP